MRNILQQLISSLQKEETVILGTIIEQSGSAPRGSGAKMLVTSDGTLFGTIGGGDVEARCHRKAIEILHEGPESVVLPFNLSSETAADAGLLCRGALRVLLQHIYPEALPLFLQLQKDFENRLHITVISTIPHHEEAVHISLITGDQITGAALPEDLLAEIKYKSQKSRLPYTLDVEGQRYFIEPQIDTGTLWLVGAGHVSLATAKLASYVDFSVRVMDDREDFANRERFPEATEVRVMNDFTNCFGELGQDDYVVIVTRGHAHDREVLRQALKKNPGYIGMIGSRKKREATYRNLIESGITSEQLASVHCPIGLAIGADTPEEISISIIGELVQHRSGILR